MNYLWDVIVKARQRGIPEKTITFAVDNSYSPYMELSHYHINNDTVGKVVYVNPYYRFYEIFKNMFNINYTEDREIRDVLLDIMLHFLTGIDARQGMTKQAFYRQFLEQDIICCGLGAATAGRFTLFSRREKDMILDHLLHLYSSGEALYHFKTIVPEIFENSIIYANHETHDEVLIYINCPRNERNENKLQLLIDLFLPLVFHTEIYWKEHFAVIGTDASMKIEQCVLY